MRAPTWRSRRIEWARKAREFSLAAKALASTSHPIAAQISIDNVEPDQISLKSLKTLDSRLVMLARYAEFHVNINSVLGAGVKEPNDAVAVTRRAVELGLTTTVGIIHDGDGQLRMVGE